MSRVKHIHEQDLKELDELATIVQQVTGVTKNEIKSRSRKKHIANARFLFCVLAVNLKQKWQNGKTKVLARYIERDHSSVVHAIYTAQNRIDTEDLYANQYYQCVRLTETDYSEATTIKQLQTSIKAMQYKLAEKDRIIADLHAAVQRWKAKAEKTKTITAGLFGEPKYN